MLYQAMQEQQELLFGMNELFPILSESHLSLDADLVAVEVVGVLVDFSVFVDGGVIGETVQFLPLQSIWATSWKMPQ